MSNRSLPLDLVRAFCVFYIIGIWHFNSYISPSYAFGEVTLVVLHRVTEVVLGTFTFLSGYFLSKYHFEGGYDVKHFLLQRFKRFFILLLLSSLSYLALKWISVKELVMIMTGTLLFTDSQVSTLWFFSMIILFYILTPILQFQYSNKFIRPILFWSVFGCFVLLSAFQLCDDRLMLYFPCYYLGLILPSTIIQRLRQFRSLLVFVLLLVSFFFIHLYTQIEYIKIMIVICGIASMLSSCLLLYHQKMDRFITFLSTASMVAYLAHRQIFGAGRMLSTRLTGETYIPLSYALILLVLTFVISYYIQVLYNKLAHYIWK